MEIQNIIRSLKNPIQKVNKEPTNILNQQISKSNLEVINEYEKEIGKVDEY